MKVTLTPGGIEKIQAGVRVLRESLRPYGLDVELICRAHLSDGRVVPYACNVVEPYGWVPEADCPLHDA